MTAEPKRVAGCDRGSLHCDRVRAAPVRRGEQGGEGISNRRVVILLHERDKWFEQGGYILGHLADVWRGNGVEVVVHRGVEGVPDADLLIPHLDLTVLPGEYARFIASQPHAVNRRVHDISKRAISRQLVRPGDGWQGPVIVKANRNANGFPDNRLLGIPWRHRVSRLARRAVGLWPPPLGSTTAASPRKYRVFGTSSDVPAAVFENAFLVVERYLPERSGDRYRARVYTFLGECATCVLRESDNAIVKAGAAIVDDTVEVPEEILTERQRLGFDYGKFDWVMHGGEPVLLDVNTTPVYRGFHARHRRRVAAMAPGIESLLT
ncbi:MAG: hypothetical protein ACYS0E_11185 [Planctomycetota bacterium]|jgi:hypothetical protein